MRTKVGRRPIVLITACLTIMAATAAADEESWRTKLAFGDRSATAERTEHGYRLTAGDTRTDIADQPASAQTASTLLDAGFALAQDELGKARVEQIQYKAFDNGQPFACECLVAGEQWPWV